MESGFPGQHTTTTTVTNSHTTHERNIRMDISYIKTLPGMLKCGQVVLNFLGFLSMIVTRYSNESRGNWFNTVSMGGFWFTGILLVMYIFHVVEKFHKIPWIKIELIFCGIWTAFYLLAAALVADYGKVSEGYGVAAFFGFCAMIAYGFDTVLKFRAFRTGAPAQGQHETTKQTSTVTSPAY